MTRAFKGKDLYTIVESIERVSNQSIKFGEYSSIVGMAFLIAGAKAMERLFEEGGPFFYSLGSERKLKDFRREENKQLRIELSNILRGIKNEREEKNIIKFSYGYITGLNSRLGEDFFNKLDKEIDKGSEVSQYKKVTMTIGDEIKIMRAHMNMKYSDIGKRIIEIIKQDKSSLRRSGRKVRDKINNQYNYLFEELWGIIFDEEELVEEEIINQKKKH